MLRPGASGQHESRQAIWKCHWKQLGWASKLNGAGSQGINRAGWSVWASLMESQIWHPPVGPVGGGLSKETMSFASTSARKRAAPLALVLMSDNAVPLCISLKLLPQCWSSKWVILVSPCVGPLRASAALLTPTGEPQFPLVFTAKSYWDFFSWYQNPGLGEPCEGPGPLVPWWWPPQRKYFSQFLITSWGYDTSSFLSSPLLPILMWLFIFLVIVLLLSQISESSWWFFCCLAVILTWLWEDTSTTFTYSAFLTRRLTWNFKKIKFEIRVIKLYDSSLPPAPNCLYLQTKTCVIISTTVMIIISQKF